MKHAEIAANARKPYAEAISRANKRVCAVVDQLAYVYPTADEASREKLISDAIYKLRTAFDAQS